MDVDYFGSDDFAPTLNAFDRSETLPTLARFIYGLTDTNLPEEQAHTLAIALAEHLLPRLRAEIARAEMNGE